MNCTLAIRKDEGKCALDGREEICLIRTDFVYASKLIIRYVYTPLTVSNTFGILIFLPFCRAKNAPSIMPMPYGENLYHGFR